jgi:hypothetical protein
MMTLNYRWTRGEPELGDMLGDDVMLAVMRRDGVSAQELDELIRSVQHRLQRPSSLHPRLPSPANDIGRRPPLL